MPYNIIEDSTRTPIGYTPYPISLAAAKDYCRVENTTTAQDELFSLWIRMAFTKVENYTGLSLNPKTIVAVLSGPQGNFELPWGPVTGTPTFVDRQNTAQTFSLVGLNFPSILEPFVYTKATYTAGYADGECPDELILAMYLLIDFYYENRGDVSPDAGFSAAQGWPPQAIAICQKWRRNIL